MPLYFSPSSVDSSSLAPSTDTTVNSNSSSIVSPSYSIASGTYLYIGNNSYFYVLDGRGSPTYSTLFKYRRPRLVYVIASSTVKIESGLDGVSGDVQVLFPDGNLRTVNNSTYTQLNTSRNCSLAGSLQSGLRRGLTLTNNTWYAMYAVKAQDNASNFVLVADTTIPIPANFATLNTNFGVNSWRYLGLIRNGDGGSTPSGIIRFVQVGNRTEFSGTVGGTSIGNLMGILVADTASGTSITWTPQYGTTGTNIPNNILLLSVQGANGGSVTARDFSLKDNFNVQTYFQVTTAATATLTARDCFIDPDIGTNIVLARATDSVSLSLAMCGFLDTALDDNGILSGTNLA